MGDLGSGQFDMKLKVYKGTEKTFETPLLDLPTAVCSFYVDNTEPRTPAIAVASGSYIYMYKNLRPYFKFTLPHLQVSMSRRSIMLPITLLHKDMIMISLSFFIVKFY